MNGNTRISTAKKEIKQQIKQAQKTRDNTGNEQEKKFQELQITKLKDCLHWLNWLTA